MGQTTQARQGGACLGFSSLLLRPVPIKPVQPRVTGSRLEGPGDGDGPQRWPGGDARPGRRGWRISGTRRAPREGATRPRPHERGRSAKVRGETTGSEDAVRGDAVRGDHLRAGWSGSELLPGAHGPPDLAVRCPRQCHWPLCLYRCPKAALSARLGVTHGSPRVLRGEAPDPPPRRACQQVWALAFPSDLGGLRGGSGGLTGTRCAFCREAPPRPCSRPGRPTGCRAAGR